jgi:hypothetical protein
MTNSRLQRTAVENSCRGRRARVGSAAAELPLSSRISNTLCQGSVVSQFDAEAALRRHVATPQTRDRRCNSEVRHDHWLLSRN